MHTRSIIRSTLAVAVLACFCATNVYAQQNGYYPNDATINSSILNAVVGYANQSDANNRTNGTSPTVNVVTGASIVFGLGSFNSSIVNVTDGSVGGLFTYDSSTANIFGGNISNDLVAQNTSTINVSGGSFNRVFVAQNTSTFNVSGGNINNTISAQDASTVNVSGGNSSNNLYAYGSSTVKVFGGNFSGNFQASSTSAVTISGGTFGQIGGANFVDQTAGVFTLVGSKLTATNARFNVNYGGTDYDLSGTLQGGTDLNGYVLNVGGGSTFTLQNVAPVPETSTLITLTILCTTGVSFVCKRRSLS